MGDKSPNLIFFSQLEELKVERITDGGQVHAQGQICPMRRIQERDVRDQNCRDPFGIKHVVINMG